MLIFLKRNQRLNYQFNFFIIERSIVLFPFLLFMYKVTNEKKKDVYIKRPIISVDFRLGAGSCASSSPLTNLVKLPSKEPQRDVNVFF